MPEPPDRPEDQQPEQSPPGRLPPSETPGQRAAADLLQRQMVRGRLPGSRYVRIVQPHAREFRRVGPGHLEATAEVLQPRGGIAGQVERLRRVLIGSRIRSELEGEERVGKLKGLALFASDNISSSAYATEEVMRVLVLAGALALTVPITLAIILVLAIVVISDRIVIQAYPGGGGSYIVGYENLGRLAGLTAGAALLTDYILTVAVSVSAGVSAITSAFPELFEQKALISVGVVVLMTILNLRGIRESGNVFAAPTYVYLAAIFGLIAIGLFRMVTGNMPEYSAPPEWATAHGTEPLALLLVLRAFASGSVGLSGVEAVSNGVPAFKPPEVKNAQIVLLVMGGCFAVIFFGLSFLSSRLGILPDPSETETVVSQLTRTLVGGTNAYYYLVQFSTAILLLLAANTAFNGFPRLASILAKDRYLPRQFQFRGDRLAFTVGVIALAVVSSILILIYNGSVTGLIPLYTVGVFLAFTLSQAGLVRRWQRTRERGWRQRLAMNVLGAAATGAVLMVVAVSKFMLGAWMVLVLIPLLIGMMWTINRHYRDVEESLDVDPTTPLPERSPPHVVVPVSRLDRSAIQALAFARSISPDVTAVHITDQPEESEEMERRWDQWGAGIQLVIIESPYRALMQPLLSYIDAVDSQTPKRPVTVVLSEFVPRHFWEYLLHNQTALRLKLRLFFRPNTIVIDVPYHLDRPEEADGPPSGG
jgi:amino acid transporter